MSHHIKKGGVLEKDAEELHALQDANAAKRAVHRRAEVHASVAGREGKRLTIGAVGDHVYLGIADAGIVLDAQGVKELLDHLRAAFATVA